MIISAILKKKITPKSKRCYILSLTCLITKLRDCSHATI